ncbi:MAG: hypothetical protein Kow00124_20300 [Anaerolineae bacterium]
MTGKWIVTAALVLIGLLATACSAAGAADLAGTNWALVTLNGEALAPDTEITLTFEVADGEARIGGTGGCNSYGGNYEQSGSALTFRDVFSTLMACEGPVMDQELSYFNALAGVTGFSLEGETLRLTGQGVELVFQAAP